MKIKNLILALFIGVATLPGWSQSIGDQDKMVINVDEHIQNTKETRVIDFVRQPNPGWVMVGSPEINVSWKVGNSDGPYIDYVQDNTFYSTFAQQQQSIKDLQNASVTIPSEEGKQEYNAAYNSEFNNLMQAAGSITSSNRSIRVKANLQCRWKNWPLYTEFTDGGGIKATITCHLKYVGTPEYWGNRVQYLRHLATHAQQAHAFYHVQFHNNAAEQISVAARYMDSSSGQWINRGYWVIQPNQTIYILGDESHITSPNLFFHAHYNSGAWWGSPPNSFNVNGEEKLFFPVSLASKDQIVQLP